MGRFSGTNEHGMVRHHECRLITSASSAVKEPGGYVPAVVPRSTAHLSLALCAPFASPVARTWTAVGVAGVRASRLGISLNCFATRRDWKSGLWRDSTR